MSRELTERQALFCLEYNVDRNGTQAAIRSGYSPKTAHATASRMLKDVKVLSEIQRLATEKMKVTNVNAERVVHELASIGFSKITDVVSWSSETGIKVKDSKDIPDHVAAAISDIKFRIDERIKKKFVNEEGVEEQIIERTTFAEVKMHKKDRSLETLSEHTGLLNRENDSGSQELNEALLELEQEDEMQRGLIEHNFKT